MQVIRVSIQQSIGKMEDSAWGVTAAAVVVG